MPIRPFIFLIGHFIFLTWRKFSLIGPIIFLTWRKFSLINPFIPLTWSDLKGLDAGAWFDRRFAGARLPRLAEVPRLLKGSSLI